MSLFRNIAPLVAAAALVGLAGCGGGSSQQAAATPPPAPPPAPAPAPPPAMVNPNSPDTLRQVQTALQQDGLYHGQVDGKWGPRTQRAVMQFQHKNGLHATGHLDQATLSAMNIGGANTSMNSAAPMAGSSAPGGAAGSSGTTNP